MACQMITTSHTDIKVLRRCKCISKASCGAVDVCAKIDCSLFIYGGSFPNLFGKCFYSTRLKIFYMVLGRRSQKLKPFMMTMSTKRRKLRLDSMSEDWGSHQFINVCVLCNTADGKTGLKLQHSSQNNPGLLQGQSASDVWPTHLRSSFRKLTTDGVLV